MNIKLYNSKLIFFSTILILTLFVFSVEIKAQEIMVYKSPTCGCCNKWVKHLEENGFKVKTQDMKKVETIKDQLGIKGNFRSCHTAKINGYFVEGHVPAKDIKRMLREKPDIKGLAVPGMPMGSPGMEGHRKDRYSVIAIDKGDSYKVYSTY